VTADAGPGDRAEREPGVYDDAELRLREIIDKPHFKIRRGKIVVDANGEPVPDPRPARKAQRLLESFNRDRARLTGLPQSPPGAPRRNHADDDPG
jgi:hypothetical protein